jgi:UDP-glucose 4-epimerase
MAGARPPLRAVTAEFHPRRRTLARVPGCRARSFWAITPALMPKRAHKPGLKVAVTGAAGDLASLLFPLLEADERVGAILALDLSAPERLGRKTTFRPVNLARPESERVLAEAFDEARIDAVAHLALPLSPSGMGALAHELEVAGTLNVLSAAARARVKRLVVSSFTVVYGARGQNPSHLEESATLHGCPGSRFVTDKVEVDRQVQAFRRARPEVKVLVLRFAPIVGPRADNPVTRMLRQKRVPTLLGFDPAWQAVHEQDAVHALLRALHADAEGAVNVVGQGVISFSGMVRLAGGQVVPLPAPLARASVRLLGHLGLTTLRAGLLDYLRFGFVADGRLAERLLGFVPRYDTRAAVAALQEGG